MHFPRLPDWLVYAAVVVALLLVALGRRERSDAPPAPPPSAASDTEGAILGPSTPFDPSVAVEVADKAEPAAGTAFSVSDSGVWVTARHVVDGCTQTALVVAHGQGVEAT